MADSRPPRSPRERTDGLAPGASTQMVKTGGLLLLAILLGVFMLNITDDGTTKPATSGTTSTTKGTGPTSSTVKQGGSTTPSTKPHALLKPDQIRIVVMNAGSFTGAAGTMSTALRHAGYTNQEQAGNLPKRKGVAVQCVTGLAREAKALQTAVANHAVIEKFPATRPAGVPAGVQCIVLLGSAT